MVVRAGRQLHRLCAKAGVSFLPSLEVEVYAGAAALHEGLESVVLEGLAFGQHVFRCLEAGAPVGMQTEPADGEKAVDLLLKLARLPGTGDHLVEIANRAGEIAA